MVVKSACRLIGDYAVWFGVGGGGEATGKLLQGALTLLLTSGLTLPPAAGAAQYAAAAFRSICVRCGAR